MEYYSYFIGGKGKMKKILSVITLFITLVGSVFAENHNKMYRTSPRENGKYYVVEYSYDGGKTWHSTGDSSPSQEEANKKIENMKNGLTASGLTKEEAKNKMAAAEKAGTGNGDWAYQKGPSDEIVEKYTGKVDPTKEEVKDAVNEIIEKAVTDK